MKRNTVFDFKIGECWNFKRMTAPGKYWVFLIIGQIKQNNKILWIVIKNGVKKPVDLWPVVIDKHGIETSDIPSKEDRFYCVDKSRYKPKWEIL